MPQGFGVALVMLGVLVPLWFWERSTFTNRVMRLMTNKTDPEGAKTKLRALYAVREEQEKRLREELWLRAQADTRARAKLRRRLEDDIKRVNLARRYMGPGDDASALQTLQEEESGAKEQLARLDALGPALHS